MNSVDDMYLDMQEAEDMILTALYLFKLPDMDFIVHFGDSCPDGEPVLSESFQRCVAI